MEKLTDTWANIVKKGTLQNASNEEEDCEGKIIGNGEICPRCGYEYKHGYGGYRLIRIACGIELKDKFPIKYGQKYIWKMENGINNIITCRGCRGACINTINLHWWWQYGENYPFYDQPWHREICQPKYDVDYSDDVFTCGRCEVKTNIICTVQMSCSLDLNLSITGKKYQNEQPITYFKCDKETGLYSIKLCLCCRDSLIDIMANKWWNAEIDDMWNHWE